MTNRLFRCSRFYNWNALIEHELSHGHGGQDESLTGSGCDFFFAKDYGIFFLNNINSGCTTSNPRKHFKLFGEHLQKKRGNHFQAKIILKSPQKLLKRSNNALQKAALLLFWN